MRRRRSGDVCENTPRRKILMRNIIVAVILAGLAVHGLAAADPSNNVAAVLLSSAGLEVVAAGTELHLLGRFENEPSS
jgi:hypothetical protein